MSPDPVFSSRNGVAEARFQWGDDMRQDLLGCFSESDTLSPLDQRLIPVNSRAGSAATALTFMVATFAWAALSVAGAARRLLLCALVVVGVSGCCAPDPVKLAAWEREVAILTSVALTVDGVVMESGPAIYRDRTPEQKKRIAAAGIAVRDNGRELMGVSK